MVAVAHLGYKGCKTSCYLSNRNIMLCNNGMSGMFQMIVPQVLLDYYVSMIDPSRAQTVDSEIMCHCAYSLPAVTFTLGRPNWPYLSQLFHTLASSLQVCSMSLFITLYYAV